MEPWKIAKTLKEHTSENPEGLSSNEIISLRAMLGRTIYILAETLRIIGILLQPFIPDKSKQMLDMLGVSIEKRTFEYAAMGKDFSYGAPLMSLGKGAHDSLFPPLEVEE